MNDFRKKPSLGYKVLSVMFSFFLLAAILAGQVGFILKNQINQQTVKTMAIDAFRELDLSKIVPSDLIGENQSFILQNVIYDAIDEYYIQSFGVEQENIDELLEQEQFQDFFDDIIDGGIEYITGGEDTQIVSTKKIINLIQDNQDEIERITGYRLVDTDFEDIEKVLREAGLDDMTWGTALDSASDYALRPIFAAYYRYMTIAFVMIAIIITASLFTLYYLNRHRASDVLMYFGVPCILSGVIVMISSFFINGIFNKIITMLDLNAGGGLYNTFTDAGNAVMYTGVAVAILGAAAVAAKAAIRAVRLDDIK